MGDGGIVGALVWGVTRVIRAVNVPGDRTLYESFKPFATVIVIGS